MSNLGVELCYYYFGGGRGGGGVGVDGTCEVISIWNDCLEVFLSLVLQPSSIPFHTVHEITLRFRANKPLLSGTCTYPFLKFIKISPISLFGDNRMTCGESSVPRRQSIDVWTDRQTDRQTDTRHTHTSLYSRITLIRLTCGESSVPRRQNRTTVGT